MNSTLPKHSEEQLLVEFIDGGERFKMHPCAMSAWKRMKKEARAEEIRLYIVSAFRSIARQSEIIERKRRNGISEKEILRVNALPGFSEHHTGRALDLNTPDSPELKESFEDSPAFRWLMQNASRFGFRLSYPRENKYGISYEPWHWFYMGKAQQDDA